MLNMIDLDLTDRRILYELDLNARIPVTKLARKLRLSREKVNYRIGNLLKKGIVRKFVTMIDPTKLGYSVYKMFFKFQGLNKEKEKEMINYLTNNNYVYWIASARGKWDLNITLFAKDINHLDEILLEFFSKYGKYIFEQEFNTTLNVGIMSKDWLLAEQKLKSKIVFFAGKIEDYKIDKTDIELLRVLANNARMSATELAVKINSSERIVIYRMKNLEKLGIILGYSTSLNLEVLEMQFFKANVSFNFLSKQDKEKVVDYCRNHPNIGFLIFCVGSWPLELEFIVKDNREFYEIMEDFRQRFPEMKGYDTMIFPKEYKFDWMPLCYKVGNNKS